MVQHWNAQLEELSYNLWEWFIGALLSQVQMHIEIIFLQTVPHCIGIPKHIPLSEVYRSNLLNLHARAAVFKVRALVLGVLHIPGEPQAAPGLQPSSSLDT